ncbi:MAG: ABC transporter permease [Bryobacteraceae bacterium]
MVRDLVHSFRRLLGHPGIAAIAILSLALGIGANTTMFSLVYASLLRPLPYPDGDRLVMIFTTALNSPNRDNRGGATTADFLDWRAQSKTLEDWQMFGGGGGVTATGVGLPERITFQHVTPGLLGSLGVRPLIGRLFEPGEEAERPALISEAYWRRRFGAEAGVLGRRLTVDGNVFTIIGVVPAGFELFGEPSSTDFWNTIDLSAGSQWMQRSVPWLAATAKLKPGVSLDQAQSELSGIAANLARAYPDTNLHRGVAVTPMLEARNGRLGSILYPLFGAVGFVLLIACINVANLLLARATARRREISVRAALGASRNRLMREFLSDGLVLAVPGIVAGLALAYGGIALFRAVAPQGFPGAGLVELNLPALSFTAAAGALAGVLAALFPALDGSKADVTEALKEGARGSAGRKRQRLRSSLVAGEIALAMILLVGAGLAINSFLRLQNHGLGFDPHNVTVAQLHLTGKRYMTDAPQREIDIRYVEPAVARFSEHLLREVSTVPGVENAALAGNVPMGPGASPGVRIRVAASSASDAELRRAEMNVVTAGFFDTLSIPLRRGRYLSDRDVEGGAWVAVVNEAFVREFFPGGDAVGQVITLVAGPDERPREIVGVIADYTQYTPRMAARPEVYTSHLQQTREIPGTFQGQRFRPKLLVRSHVAGIPKAETIAKIVADFDKDLAIFDVKTLQQHVAMRGAPARFYANALGLFSAIALVLAAIGIYGLMNYSVTDRFHEIGIRLSLGASRPQIIWLIVSYGVKLASAGLVLGIAGALVATRLLDAMLFGVKPWDPFTFLLVTGFLLAVAVTACVIPAMRATVIDPVVALRQE